MKSLKSLGRGELNLKRWMIIKVDWWLQSADDESCLMLKVDWWLKLIDDKVLQTNEWMDNAISSRVTFATKNELIIE